MRAPSGSCSETGTGSPAKNPVAEWDLNPDTRIGIAYRAPIKYNASGNVSFDNPTPSVPPALAPVVALLAQQVNTVALYNGGIHSTIKLPDEANLSFFQTINDRWDWMADVQWTGWSTLKDLTFVRSTGPVLQSTPENFDDTWRFAIGANYKYNDQWKFRGGVAFDQESVTAVHGGHELTEAAHLAESQALS